ncbi:hypothetical protein AMK27_36480 [Streptomyces sp. CB02009]|uniref:MFS transporter n=1 Tax=Streptomyces sp. CB02009 TaxID=1703938 RepID=UPI00093DC26F|nr:MFS transporter [Streptomyces sp. CB02009]OKJ49548.1 hypothetical protein AMK27_36480 [Streptomyces sp. CB02009]
MPAKKSLTAFSPATVTLFVYTRLSDRYGRRLLLVVGMLIFLAGSAACAGAQSMGQLIAFRAVQGLRAGALEGLSFLMVSDLHTGQCRSSAQGALAGLMALSFLGGPLVGGFLTDTVGRRSTLLVNLLIGIAALCVILRVLPAKLGRNESRRIPLDLLGISVLVLAVGPILQGLDSSTRSEDWASLGSLGALGLGCGLLFVFVRAESWHPHRSYRPDCCSAATSQPCSHPVPLRPSRCSPASCCCRRTSST